MPLKVIITLILINVPGHLTTCPQSWYYMNDYPSICYSSVYKSALTWTAAQTQCASLSQGATLPYFNTLSEYQSYRKFSIFQNLSASCDYFWLGLDGSGKWVNNQTATLNYFDPAEVSSCGSSYVVQHYSTAYGWTKVCNLKTTSLFLCQLRVGDDPPQAAATYSQCQNGWLADSFGNCYSYVSTPDKWSNAMSTCSKLNASLPQFCYSNGDYTDFVQQQMFFEPFSCIQNTWLGSTTGPQCTYDTYIKFLNGNPTLGDCSVKKTFYCQIHANYSCLTTTVLTTTASMSTSTSPTTVTSGIVSSITTTATLNMNSSSVSGPVSSSVTANTNSINQTSVLSTTMILNSVSLSTWLITTSNTNASITNYLMTMSSVPGTVSNQVNISLASTTTQAANNLSTSGNPSVAFTYTVMNSSTNLSSFITNTYSVSQSSSLIQNTTTKPVAANVSSSANSISYPSTNSTLSARVTSQANATSVIASVVTATNGSTTGNFPAVNSTSGNFSVSFGIFSTSAYLMTQNSTPGSQIQTNATVGNASTGVSSSSTFTLTLNATKPGNVSILFSSTSPQNTSYSSLPLSPSYNSTSTVSKAMSQKSITGLMTNSTVSNIVDSSSPTSVFASEFTIGSIDQNIFSSSSITANATLAANNTVSAGTNSSSSVARTDTTGVFTSTTGSTNQNVIFSTSNIGTTYASQRPVTISQSKPVIGNTSSINFQNSASQNTTSVQHATTKNVSQDVSSTDTPSSFSTSTSIAQMFSTVSTLSSDQCTSPGNMETTTVAYNSEKLISEFSTPIYMVFTSTVPFDMDKTGVSLTTTVQSATSTGLSQTTRYFDQKPETAVTNTFQGMPITFQNSTYYIETSTQKQYTSIDIVDEDYLTYDSETTLLEADMTSSMATVFRGLGTTFLYQLITSPGLMNDSLLTLVTENPIFSLQQAFTKTITTMSPNGQTIATLDNVKTSPTRNFEVSVRVSVEPVTEAPSTALQLFMDGTVGFFGGRPYMRGYAEHNTFAFAADNIFKQQLTGEEGTAFLQSSESTASGDSILGITSTMQNTGSNVQSENHTPTPKNGTIFPSKIGSAESQFVSRKMNVTDLMNQTSSFSRNMPFVGTSPLVQNPSELNVPSTSISQTTTPTMTSSGLLPYLNLPDILSGKSFLSTNMVVSTNPPFANVQTLMISSNHVLTTSKAPSLEKSSTPSASMEPTANDLQVEATPKSLFALESSETEMTDLTSTVPVGLAGTSGDDMTTRSSPSITKIKGKITTRTLETETKNSAGQTEVKPAIGTTIKSASTSNAASNTSDLQSYSASRIPSTLVVTASSDKTTIRSSRADSIPGLAESTGVTSYQSTADMHNTVTLQKQTNKILSQILTSSSYTPITTIFFESTKPKVKTTTKDDLLSIATTSLGSTAPKFSQMSIYSYPKTVSFPASNVRVVPTSNLKNKTQTSTDSNSSKDEPPEKQHSVILGSSSRMPTPAQSFPVSSDGVSDKSSFPASMLNSIPSPTSRKLLNASNSSMTGIPNKLEFPVNMTSPIPFPISKKLLNVSNSGMTGISDKLALPGNMSDPIPFQTSIKSFRARNSSTTLHANFNVSKRSETTPIPDMPNNDSAPELAKLDDLATISPFLARLIFPNTTVDQTNLLDDENNFAKLPTSGKLDALGVDQDALYDPMALTSSMQDSLSFIMQSLNDSLMFEIGEQRKSLIFDCLFDRYSCNNDRDIIRLRNNAYGNCFSFNNHNSNLTKYTISAGMENGLKMIMHIDQADYNCNVEQSGIRMIIHDQDVQPTPEMDGYYIETGVVTYFNIIQNCQTMCYQDYMVSKCNCTDPRYMSVESRGYPKCGIEKKTCLDYYLNCNNTLDQVYCDCRPKCSDISYTATMTKTQMKTNADADHECRLDSDASICHKDLNYALLYVYYGSMSAIVYSEDYAYGFVQLLSDFSGVGGLYTGVAGFTAFECIPFVYWSLKHLFKIAADKMKKRKLSHISYDK